MVLSTRKPSGRAPWPMVLLAGREKAGKTWAALEASGSPMIGRTLYVGVGEDDPDEYALIPGARFEIVEHDGSFAGILGAVRDAIKEPDVDGLPTLLVLDSATRVWNLLSDSAQAVANKRANGARDPLTADYTVTPDLWNSAASQWAELIWALKAHRGPVVVTARLDLVIVMEGGKPARSGAKEWKVQAHKSLPFDVDAVVQMPERGEAVLTGLRSARVGLERPRQVPGFTVAGLWELMGLSPESAGVRGVSHTVLDGAKPAGWRAAVDAAADRGSLNRVAADAAAGGWFDDEVRAALNARLAALGGPMAEAE